MTTELIHGPTPWYWEAGSSKCPHGSEPDRDSDAWDAWAERHVGSPQDVFICLDAPMGDMCSECSANHNEAVPWSACDARAHAFLRPGVKAGADHAPVEVWVGTTECLERECEEYFTEDGDEIPGKDRCSHIGVELICGGCSTQSPGGYYEPAVSWPGRHSTPPGEPCHCGRPIPAGRVAYCSLACQLADKDHGSDEDEVAEVEE